MSWFLLGIIPPALWAVVNHLDKYLLSKKFHKSSVNVLMVYSTWFSLVVLPFLFYFAKDNLFVNWGQIFVQILGGILMTVSIYFYLMALYRDEASVVMPLALLVPVFGYVLSFLLLGEVLSSKQLVACLLIIVGAFILSLEFNKENKLGFRRGVLLFMVLCTASQAVQEVLFKLVTINNSFVASLFWLHAGIIICGIFLVIIHKNLFSEFVDSVKANGRLMFGINFLSEGVSAIAYMVRDYSLLLAPVAVIMTLNGYQPAFVFIFGIILTLLVPRFVNERIKISHLVHRGAAIIIMVLGTIMIAQTL